MTHLFKSVSLMVASLSLFGCIGAGPDHMKINGDALEYNVKQNAAACDSGYRKACESLMRSGCVAGTEVPACRLAGDEQRRTLISLSTKCDQGDRGACYTLRRINCGKGNPAACEIAKTTDAATLANECKNGDQLACTDPPPGMVAAATSVLIGWVR